MSQQQKPVYALDKDGLLADVGQLRELARQLIDIIEVFLREKDGEGEIPAHILNLINLSVGTSKTLVVKRDDKKEGGNEQATSNEA